ncbi:MAG: putative enzyme related to lactoylglutathione lyase [Glaciecola sp.]|jgi:predicted enzyme related to lactoylglutathione lyase
MDAQSNNLNWFEISVSDFERAKAFYENIFNIEMPQHEMMGMKMAFFPAEPKSGKASGGIAHSMMHKPSNTGTIVYLNANPVMDGVLEKIESAGGKVLMPKTAISPEIGYMAYFEDSEGNKIGLHSQE